MKLRRNDRELASEAYKALSAYAAGQPLSSGQEIVLIHLGLAERCNGRPLSITELGELLHTTGPDFFPYE